MVVKFQFMKIGIEHQHYVNPVCNKGKTDGMTNHVQVAAQPYESIEIGTILLLYVKVVWKGKRTIGMK